ncbi:DivIVA domain-containing protein [Agilicoccus flavus]|uniref:DivIVA domain-containing protein n=1 Tax=Agilicoccus flavus TaxID=2775968 RepID=UPI001CF67BF1|nr:DivIVA domain-containing protein [Agilicoccus flavus]
MVFLVASLVVLAGIVVALVLGRGGANVHLGPALDSAGGVGLPDGPVTSDAVADVRFDTGFRGYRTDQVDAVLDALVARLAELESERGVRASPAVHPSHLGPGAGPRHPCARPGTDR